MKNIKNMIRQRNASHGDEDKGFTLVEILIAIVLVGILSAVVVVGISNLTSSGSKSACAASLDAAKAGTVVYYATPASGVNKYPVTFTELTAGSPAALTIPSGTAINSAALVAGTGGALATAGVGMAVVAGSWQLTMTSTGAASLPTFACANA